MLKSATPIIAILAITTLECVALSNGINGATFASTLAIIGGLGGFTIGRLFAKPKDKP